MQPAALLDNSRHRFKREIRQSGVINYLRSEGNTPSQSKFMDSRQIEPKNIENGSNAPLERCKTNGLKEQASTLLHTEECLCH